MAVKKKVPKATTPKPTAKGKKKRAAREAQADLENSVGEVEVIQSDQREVKKSDVDTREVINIMADSIEEIYRTFGSRIDRVNADDKARTLLLEIKHKGPKVRIREKNYKTRYCKAHRD